MQAKLSANNSRAKRQVLEGGFTKTKSGMTAKDLKVNKSGKVRIASRVSVCVCMSDCMFVGVGCCAPVHEMQLASWQVVSKKKSALGKKNLWSQAVAQARKELKIEGFQIIGGKTKEGQAYLKKAKSIHAKLKAKA